jgi:hypothetical protein
MYVNIGGSQKPTKHIDAGISLSSEKYTTFSFIPEYNQLVFVHVAQKGNGAA